MRQILSKHLLNGSHQGLVHWVGVALRTSVELGQSTGASALACVEAVAIRVGAVAPDVHTTAMAGTGSGCISVDSFVVATLTK